MGVTVIMIGIVIMVCLAAGMPAYLFYVQKELYSKRIPLFLFFYLTAIFSSLWIMLKEPQTADMAVRMALAFVLAAGGYIDYEKKLIPNTLLLFLAVCGIVYYIGLFFTDREAFPYLAGAKLLTGLGFLAVFLLIALLSKGIGGGDVKAIGLIGCLCGYTLTVSNLMWALVLSMFVSIALLVRRKKRKEDEIPFCPFLYAGYIVTLLLYYI